MTFTYEFSLLNMEVLKRPCVALDVKQIASYIVDSNVTTWYLQQHSFFHSDDQIWGELSARLSEMSKELAPLDFVNSFINLYKKLYKMRVSYIDTLKHAFNGFLHESEALRYAIINSDIVISVNINDSFNDFLSFVPKYSDFKHLTQIEQRLIQLFPSCSNIIATAVDSQISADIIHKIPISSYDDEETFEIFKRASTTEAKTVVSKNWSERFKQLSYKNTSEFVDIILKIINLHKQLNYINLDEMTREVWQNEKFGVKHWNLYLHKTVLALYGSSNTKIDDLRAVCSTIHHINNYDVFIINYMYKLKKRIITLMMKFETFPYNYNLERNILECFDTKYVCDTVNVCKQSLFEVLKSYHFSTKYHDTTSDVCTHALITNTQSKPMDVVVPPQIHSHISALVDTYTDIYPERKLELTPQTIVCIKLNGVKVSGTLPIISLIVRIAMNNNQIVFDALLYDLFEKQTPANQQKLTNMLEVLAHNNLIKDCTLVVPPHSIILKESVKKQTLAVKEKESQMNRDLITMCYLAKAVKHISPNVIDETQLFKDTARLITIFTLTDEIFKRALQSCLKRSVIFENDGKYSFNE